MLPETRTREGDVLGVGIDWAEEFHLVALGSPGEGVIEVLRVEHRPEAVSALVERIAGMEADPAEVRVARFVRNDRLTDALMAQAFASLSASPGVRALYDEAAAWPQHETSLPLDI
jgi:hypothetical protein